MPASRRTEWLVRVLVVLGILLLCNSTHAQVASLDPSLFRQMGGGARALGMGGAFTAIADDATAASWNPAGLAQKDRVSLTISLIPYFSSDLHAGVYLASQQNGSVILTNAIGPTNVSHSGPALDFLGVTVPIKTARLRKYHPVLQVSYHNVHNLGFDGDLTNQAEISEVAVVPPERRIQLTERQDDTRATQRSFSSFAVSAAAGYGSFKEPGDFSLGFSLGRWDGGYSQETEGTGINSITGRSLFNTPYAETLFRISFSDQEAEIVGWNFALGGLVQLTRQLRLGAMYRTTQNMEAEFHSTTRRTDEFGETEIEVEDEFGELKYPSSWAVGIAYRHTPEPDRPKWTVSLDFAEVLWADSYFVTADDPQQPFPFGRRGDEDLTQWRIGFEYLANYAQRTHKRIIPLRIGFIVESDPLSSSSSPIAVGRQERTNYGITTGIGIQVASGTIDAALVHFQSSYESDTIVRYEEYESLQLVISGSWSF